MASAERYSGDSDHVEHKACIISVHWDDDPDMGPPWEEHDGHGVVTDGDLSAPDDRDSDRYGRLSPWRRGTNGWYYDFDSSLEVACKDQWGLCDDDLGALALKLGRAPTTDEIIEAAVQADFEHLRDWCHDEWRWLIADVIVDVRTTAGTCLVSAISSLGGIESKYAAESIGELVAEARAWINKNQAAIAAIASSHIALEDARAQLTSCD